MNTPNANMPVARAIVAQVQLARPANGSERDVTTIITRPMWRQFLVELDYPDLDAEPVNSGPFDDILQAFGSHTIVIDRDHHSAVSFVEQPEANQARFAP